MTDETLRFNIDQLKILSELLLGAAHADGDFDGHEAETIGDILRAHVPEEELPHEVTRHIAHFNAESFDLELACTLLGVSSSGERRGVLRLVSEVTHADDVLDLAENEYIVQVAKALGASPEEYEDLTFEILPIEVVPPPLPK
ncbi:MAG: TerB family tellurite resistance protein [Myxococcota bacterium]